MIVPRRVCCHLVLRTFVRQAIVEDRLPLSETMPAAISGCSLSKGAQFVDGVIGCDRVRLLSEHSDFVLQRVLLPFQGLLVDAFYSHMFASFRFILCQKHLAEGTSETTNKRLFPFNFQRIAVGLSSPSEH